MNKMNSLKINNVVTCCENCKERHFKCHSECEKYKKQRELLEELKEKERKRKVPSTVYFEAYDRILAARKRRRRY